MANLEKQFKNYLEKLRLSNTREDQLKRSRDSDRETIQDYFRDGLNIKKPTFHMQGSFEMKTIINPLNEEYDLDDGVYLQHLPEDFGDWPRPATVHGYIKNALANKTSEPPIDKDTCVRLVYKNDYHIDFPIYGISENMQYLAHKSEGWIESNPKELTKWTLENIQSRGEQLRRLVKYLKGWKDFKQNNVKLPSGMILTILIANHYQKNNTDQISFVETCDEVFNYLSNNFYLERPVSPHENLFENYTNSQRDNFLTQLKALIEDGNKAVNLSDSKSEEASKLWRKHLGDRFPLAPNSHKESSNDQERVYVNITHKKIQKPWQKL